LAKLGFTESGGFLAEGLDGGANSAAARRVRPTTNR